MGQINGRSSEKERLSHELGKPAQETRVLTETELAAITGAFGPGYDHSYGGDWHEGSHRFGNWHEEGGHPYGGWHERRWHRWHAGEWHEWHEWHD